MHRLFLLLFGLALASFFGCGQDVGGPDAGLTSPIPIEPQEGASTASAVLLRWSEDPEALHYRVQMAMDAGFTHLHQETTVTVHPWVAMQDLQLDGQYFWRVRSESVNEVSEWSTVRSLVVDRSARTPTPPRLVAPAYDTQGLDTRVRVEWEPVEGAYAYHLIVTLDEAMLLYQADLENLREPYFDLENLVFTYPYWWKVRALGPSGYSEWSSVSIFWIRSGL